MFFRCFKTGNYSVKSESGSSQSGRLSEETHKADTNKVFTQSNYNEETGQPPVIGASTTEQVVIFASFTAEVLGVINLKVLFFVDLMGDMK